MNTTDIPPRYRLCAFSDEASPRIPDQICALRRNRIGLMEMRGVNHKNVADLPLSEARVVRMQLDSAGIRVFSLGSPAGKTGIREDFGPALDRFLHLLEVADVVGARCMRIFSFYGTEGDPAYRDEVLERMSRFVEAAKGSGVVLCHENEKGIYGDVPERCLEIHRAIPEIRAVFDPANFVQCGVDTLAAWETLRPYVHYGHIKDAKKNGKVVPPGTGEGRLREYLPDLLTSVKDPVLTLEPHLSKFVGLAGLEQAGNTSDVGAIAFRSPDEAFDYAVRALREILAAAEETA